MIKYFIVRFNIFMIIIHLMEKPSKGGIPANMIMVKKRIDLGIEETFALLISLESLVWNGLILAIKMLQ